METSNKSGLHPLLTAAAISVTVFSAVGVGALTGVLPHSFGSAKESTPPALVAAPDAAASIAARSQPLPQPNFAPTESPMPPATASATPKKHVAPKPKQVAAARAQQYEPVTERDFAGTPPPPPAVQTAQAPAPVIEAPKPVPAGKLGVVESVREISTPAEKSNGVGPIAGGIAGAVLGDQVGKGMGGANTRKVVTVLGAAAGAFGGRAIESRVRAEKHWEITVRLDDGSYQTLNSQSQPYWHGGERVRLLDGKLNPA